MMIDESLYKDITQKLNFTPILNAKNIIIGVKDGIVTLTGTVDNFFDKWSAIHAVKTVNGVVAVVDELQVKLLDACKRTDTEIAQAAVQALKWNMLIPHEDIKVEVKDGYVTLTGEVRWNFQKDEVEKIIRRLTGVKGISNLITLKKAVFPADVKKQIESEFERNAQIDAKNIDVEVRGSEVILTGKVHSWAEIKQATRAAWSVPGVTSVVNNLTVIPSY